MSSIRDLNRDHFKECPCFCCKKYRKRYTQAEFDVWMRDGRDCRHCGYRSGSHASGWSSGDVLSSGACIMAGLSTHGKESLTFPEYEQKFSSEYIFEPML